MYKAITGQSVIEPEECNYVNFEGSARVYSTIIMDNGANVHMFSDKWMFTRYQTRAEPTFVVTAGGQRLLILGEGDVGNLTGVLHVEGIVKNLVSLTFLARSGCSYFGQYDFCDLYDVNDNFLLRGQIQSEDLLVVDIQDLFNMPYINYEDGLEFQREEFNRENIIFMTINETIDIMHRRLGHIGRNRVRYMINEGLTSLPYSDTDKFFSKHVCRTCALGKSHRKAHNKCHAKCTVKGGRWYADLTEISDESVNGNRYVLGFIDSNTNILYQYFIPKKEIYKEVSQWIDEVIKPLRAAYNLTHIELITDCGTEFDNKDIRKLLMDNGIRPILTCPYTYEHHGKIERVWRTIDDMSRCMLIESKLDENWWEHARETAGYIYNRVVNAQNEVPPYTQMYGTRESLSHLRIFGSRAYPNIPLQLRLSDHQDVAYEGILVGYSPGHLLSYKIYVPKLNLLIITAYVTF